MKDGIINVYKPAGMTSNDVIYKMRSVLGIRKLGHTGTLDPMATGVLPVLINRGTRITEYLDLDFKTYVSTMVLGMTTDTQDVTGNVISKVDMDKHQKLTEKDIRDAFSGFSGLIYQLPPMYSAVRINGKKLYEFMHSGEEIPEEFKEKIKPRQVFIKEIEVLNFDEKAFKVTFRVTCSKGTYIRTICQDVGDILGCGAAMESLERTASGAFTKDNSYTLEEIRQYAKEVGILDDNYYSINKVFHEEIPLELEKYVVGLDFPMTIFGEAVVNQEVAKKFVDGWHISYKECKIRKKPEYEDIVDPSLIRTHANDPTVNAGSNPGLKYHPEYAGGYKIYREDGLFLGVAFHSNKYHKLVADKVFLRTEEL